MLTWATFLGVFYTSYLELLREEISFTIVVV